MSVAEPRKSHWIIASLFSMAREQGLHKRAWEPLQSKIEEGTGVKIPKGTLRYWNEGYSLPRLDEVEMIAKALGYELDLMLGETPDPLRLQPKPSLGVENDLRSN